MPTEWAARIWAEFRAGNLTRAWRDALLTLQTFRGHGGMICPSHATVGARTCLAPKTVERALHTARNLGLIEWAERRIRRGWRWLKTSNRYFLIVPDAAVEPGLRLPRRPTDRLKVGGVESKQERRLTREALVAVPLHIVRAAREKLASIAGADCS
jgi:transposase InsO family protein